jgi:hypothetical protein
MGEKKQTACKKQRFNSLGQQMTWPLQETWALQVESSSSILPIVKVHNNLFLVYTKLNALSYGYKLSLFGGALSLYMVWCTFWTQLDPPLLK